MQTNGTLYIIATPIGNLEDITLRALSTLKSVDAVLAEDTRHSRHLLNHFSIDKPLIALHEHNEREKTDAILARLQSGENLGLISDAGTPLISDPGFYLVRAARLADITVVPIPGACAAVAALSASGLPTDRFCFEGFLPAKTQARQKALLRFKSQTATVVLYESTHRIIACLEDIAQVLPKREVTLAKEITKQFEAIKQGCAQTLLAWLQQDVSRHKGEFVLLIKGTDKFPVAGDQFEFSLNDLLQCFKEWMPPKLLAKQLAKLTGVDKKKIYQEIIELK